MKRKFELASLCAMLTLCLAVHGQAGEINLVGTENGEPVFEAVAKAFSKSNPDVKVLIPESIDSGGGIAAVGTGKAVIARVARDFTEEEKKYGLKFVPFAKMQIVFFVNKGVTVEDLTPKQICDIYSGKVKNWKDLGGGDRKIRVVNREEGDSNVETLEDCLEGFEDLETTARSKIVLSDSAALDVVEKKAGAIGFGAYGLTQNADVKVLKIGGKGPDTPDYACAHPLGFVFREKDKTGIIKKFVDFALSEEARDAVAFAGGSPL